MNIVIVGNPKTNGERIKEIASEFIDAGVSVRYPSMDGLETSEDIPVIETFERIDWSNYVIAIPHDGLNMDIATTNALAYAKHVKKPVFIYYE